VLTKASMSVAQGQLRYAPTRNVADLAQEWLAVIEPNRKATTAAADRYSGPRLAMIVRRGTRRCPGRASGDGLAKANRF
jgi:hypothetical protein